MANGILGMPPGVLNQQQGTQLMGAANDQARQRAINSGLVAAGANILEAPNLMSGIGAGLRGFNTGYNTELIANRPKVTPLAGGAFSQITFPDGRVEVMSNQDVQKFLMEQEQAGAQTALNKILLQADLTTKRDEAKSARERAAEATPLLRATNELLGKYKNAIDIVNTQIDPNNPNAFIDILGLGKVNAAKAQALAPGLAGFFGGSQVAANKFLQELKVAETLANTALTKGAISNAEMALFMSPIPALTDDREKVWKPWLEARLPVLEKIQKFYQQRAQSGQTEPTPSENTATGSAQTMPVQPQTTPQARPLPTPTVSPNTLQFLQP